MVAESIAAPRRAVPGQQPGRALGDQHLAAVRRRGDPRGAVHVDADVVAVGEQRVAGVDAHAHPHRHASRPALRESSAVCEAAAAATRTGGVVESDEEAVALRVDLVAPVVVERATQDAPMAAQDIRVAVAELVQEPGRPLDVREQERDGASRQIASHANRLTAIHPDS